MNKDELFERGIIAEETFYVVEGGRKFRACELCGRKLPLSIKSRHHLVPRSRGGKASDIIFIHRICHNKIHSIFTNKELKKNFNTIEKIRQVTEIKNFIEWVKNKPFDYVTTFKENKKFKERFNVSSGLSIGIIR